MCPEGDLTIRPAAPEDLPLLRSFIRSMAEFEKLEMSATEEALREASFGEVPAARALLGFVGAEPAAYAVYFFSFATMVGRRGFWLDDLFVDPRFRGRGIGKAFLDHLVEIARKHGCARMEWMVLDWNRGALEFYQRLGARILEDWKICRLELGD